MVRKSANSKSVKAISNSIFDIKFEVVLIIVLIVVAILLVCFINKKFNREQFYVSMIKEHMYSEENQMAPSNLNKNNLPNYYEGFDLSGSSLPKSLNELTGRHVFILLGPSWCGHSKNYLKERHREFVTELSNIGKDKQLHALDVDIKDSQIIDEIKTKSKVNALPSLFLYENNNFKKEELNVNVAVEFLV